MTYTDRVTINFNDNISTVAVYLDIEKAFETTYHPSFLYKLSEFHFSSSLIKVIISFLYNRKFRVLVEDEISSCPPPEIYKQDCRKVHSYPLPCTFCI